MMCGCASVELLFNKIPPPSRTIQRFLHENKINASNIVVLIIIPKAQIQDFFINGLIEISKKMEGE